jgi:1-acyl-sn-glycerol-3-phosphate acyltransferase
VTARASPIPEDRLIARLLRTANLCLSQVYHNLEVLRPCPIPETGPAIVVCNHISGLDPALIQSTTPRLITWMMAKEFYELRSLNWIFRSIGAIPVARGGRDMAATRAALRTLEAGGVLGIFPEGRIENSRELMPFQTGVALLACRSGAAVYPAYLDGTCRNASNMFGAYLLRHRAMINFGDAIPFEKCDPTRETLDAATARIEQAVQRLKDETEKYE